MNEKFILILLVMIFLHIVDDYYLQGILASMKQRSWWEKNYPDKIYKNDFIMALIAHSFSWSFMINLPWIIYVFIYNNSNIIGTVVFMVLTDTAIHAITDNNKANKLTINLITDQSIHLIQIMLTFLIYYIMIVN